MTGIYVLEPPWNQRPETRAAALRVMQRLAPDLVEMLGLGDEDAAGPPADTKGRRICGECRRVIQIDRVTCRHPECPAGPKSRGSAR